MWTVRVVAVALLALMAQVMWLVGRLMGRTDLFWVLAFGALAGIPTAVIVLAMTPRSVPAPEPITASCDYRTEAQRHADGRAALEAEYRNAGTWTVINGRTCYVVPAVDWMGDGEKLGTGYGNTCQYYCGDYRSDHQFTIAACLSQFGSVMRRPAIGGWGDWL